MSLDPSYPLAIADTTVLLFLHRIESLGLLRALFRNVLVPDAVAAELAEAHRLGHDVPALQDYAWLHQRRSDAVPPEWLTFDLGSGELGAMALARENKHSVLLLDDRLAKQIAEASGLEAWGTLRVLLEAKRAGHVERVAPLIERLVGIGMWLSTDVREGVLSLAGEHPGEKNAS